jgi:hypothetical protein
MNDNIDELTPVTRRLVPPKTSGLDVTGSLFGANFRFAID